ncbi:MAG: DUF502 domain-containing protein [Dehalococcoidia bacterium]|nr:DUF502 domain-containing protein [Dehalococcoidia bacterium]
MQREVRPGLGKRVRAHFRRTIITGLLLLVPVVLTYLVLRLLFNFLDGILQPVFRALGRGELPGVGLVSLVALIYIAGLFGANFLGKRLVSFGQATLLRMPVIGSVYSSARQLIESFSGGSSTGFKRVVLIEYPGPGLWSVGFLTSVTTDENGKSMGLIYIPTAPTPQSGWVALVPVENIYDTDLTVPVAMRLVLSGGIVTPGQIKKKALAL